MSVTDTGDMDRLDFILYDRPAGRNIIGHAIDTLTALRVEVRELKQALEGEKQLHALAKAFHDVAVSQRNAAWAENERLKEAFRQNQQPDWSR